MQTEGRSVLWGPAARLALGISGLVTVLFRVMGIGEGITDYGFRFRAYRNLI